ncbi:MAG: hypothetical protein Terrestrivirus2_195 [Terrestrivirus sp.]|uniref:DNA mismatch repair proteins mutS family domain-containing protein n=1 Tax=Terrestrivirus sp. TaxID=2487775 RepID=A0A3G4ZLH7_9VIRU|nr:MAG: hypothetical protein Terrestrivirus2_195 [Terrestrivirus sp.]
MELTDILGNPLNFDIDGNFASPNITNIVKDLNLFGDIFPHINKCTTKTGTDQLKSLLMSPSHNYEELALRQKTISNFHKNKKTTNKIKKTLSKIKGYEELVKKWFWWGDHDMYLPFDMMNNGLMLDIIHKVRYSMVFLMLSIYTLIYIYFRWTGFYVSFYDYLQSIYMSYVSTMEWLTSYVVSQSYENVLYISSHFLAIFYVLYVMTSYYNMFHGGISHYYRCEEYKESYRTMGDIIILCEKIKNLQNNITKNSSEDIDIKIKNLKEIFGEDKETMNKYLGESIMVQYNKKNYESDFTELMKYIGKIDAYISISDLLNENYSLPYFVKNGSKPILHIENLWNPQIYHKDNIKNDFSPLEQSLTVITGPNKAGKSTYMRSIFLSVYLSQTLGISCCEQIIFTPFKHLFTYLNVPDVIGRESLFEAELNRMYGYYNFLSSMNNNNNDNEFAFSIIDELFTGTNPQEGMASSYAICKYLSSDMNSINVISTHFGEICKGDIKDANYIKFSGQKNDKGQYKFTYKAENGVSDQYIAIELLKERGYSSEIVDTALNKMAKNNNIQKID